VRRAGHHRGENEGDPEREQDRPAPPKDRHRRRG
jgi:hypothetical protein